MIRRIVPWILLLLAGCRSNGPSSDGAVKELRSNEGANTASGLAPYSLGRWRLVPPEELTRSVLWVSHILVRHAGSNRQVPGSVALWRLEPPPAGRTRAEALVLAERVASEAQRAPEQFAALARQYSEDVTTRDRGGSLGGVRASDFLLDPEALDALAALRPGEVSRVVETAHGLLIFQRRAPVAPDTVTGVHVVIGHDDTHWLANVGAPSPQRSREQARALALDVYEQARTNPEGFSELVARYSEHPDRNEGGDIGSWSTREPTIYPRAVQALEGLKVGEMRPPSKAITGSRSCSAYRTGRGHSMRSSRSACTSMQARPAARRRRWSALASGSKARRSTLAASTSYGSNIAVSTSSAGWMGKRKSRAWTRSSPV